MPELLEVYEPHGAFARIEGWLTDRGFFGPGSDGLVAELYLGYGLSEAIRRGTTPPPPEPCRPLPLAACRVGADAGSGSRGSYGIGPWEQTWTGAEYGAAVEEVRTAIARGDVYQVNLVQHLRAPFSGDPRELARRLGCSGRCSRAFRHRHLECGLRVPELFLSRRGDRLSTRPIKGTRPRGAAAELRDSAKDAAEHVMIVDLERNDLSRVCEAGSIHWPELMETQALAGVEHMVSTVEGTLRPGAGLREILEATFPGGSVTGAPKIAAVDLIAELEPVGRGASMGAIGRVHGNGDVDLALTIRTFAIAEGSIHLWVGGGVVWDSDPSAEVEESWTKAAPLLEAAGSRMLEAALS